jgi:hypothetical protein
MPEELEGLPTIAELAREIHNYAGYLKRNYSADDLRETPDDTAGGDFRLQVHDGAWYTHTGDPQYDQDHRGAWSSAFVPRGAGLKRCREIAREMLREIE